MNFEAAPPYDPRMMVKVWIYALMKGIRSSRKIEKALYEDVGFRFLSANQQPGHWTISEFRKRHHKALGGLIEQTVRLAENVTMGIRYVFLSTKRNTKAVGNGANLEW
ncbi:MAG TPA: transposase [Firmicutes bacterium]|nr:transposase [Candidatus Fermentithermobacillaceae bacterium]